MMLQWKMAFILGILSSICLIIASCYTAVTPTVSPRIVSEWSLQESNGDAGITNGITGKINDRDYLFLLI